MVAVNTGGEGARSDIQSVTLRPGQVMGLSAIGNDGEVALSWSAVDGADSYRIYRALGAASPSAPALTHLTPTSPATITATSYTDTSTTNGQIYRYQVVSGQRRWRGGEQCARHGNPAAFRCRSTRRILGARRRRRNGNDQLECGRWRRLLHPLPRHNAGGSRERVRYPRLLNVLHRQRSYQGPHLLLPSSRGDRRYGRGA